MGLKNLGSTCYINSVLQQLYCNQLFRSLILRINDQREIEPLEHKGRVVDDNILHQLQKIFAFLELSSRLSYSPDDFCVAYKLYGEPVNVLMQQDVHEFIQMFFDQLENKIKCTPFKRVVDNFYGGKVVNIITCSLCQ